MDDFDFDFDFQGEANPGFTGYTISDDPSNYNPYEEILRGFAPNPTGNLETDFVVNERGQIIDTAGNRGSFSFGGNWVPNADLKATSANTDFLKSLFGKAKNIGGKALDFAQTPQGIMALLSALAAYKDRARPSGGGTTQAYAGYKPLQRTMTQGAYGPIARYAANGGIMHAYANGGTVQMEDGGFVMTKKAVDGAGGPRGIAQLVPGARMIGGPPDPTGKRDLTPAVINGPHGQTPAKVSRGEAYIPKAVVQANGGSKAMYDKMHALQRRA